MKLFVAVLFTLLFYGASVGQVREPISKISIKVLFLDYQKYCDRMNISAQDKTSMDQFCRYLTLKYEAAHEKMPMEDSLQLEQEKKKILLSKLASNEIGRKDTLYKLRIIQKRLPQDMLESDCTQWKLRWDSIFEVLNRDKSLISLVQNKFSDITGVSKMNLLEMPIEFFNVLSSLKKGDISEPFYTSEGVNMLVLLGKEVRNNRPIYHKVDLQKVINLLLPKIDIVIDTLNQSSFISDEKVDNRVVLQLDTVKYYYSDFERFKDYSRCSNVAWEPFLERCMILFSLHHFDTIFPVEMWDLSYRKDTLKIEQLKKRQIQQFGFMMNLDLPDYIKNHKKELKNYGKRFVGTLVCSESVHKGSAARKFLSSLPMKERNKATRMVLKDDVVVYNGEFLPGNNDAVDKYVFHISGTSSVGKKYLYHKRIGKIFKEKVTREQIESLARENYLKTKYDKWTKSLENKYHIEVVH